MNPEIKLISEAYLAMLNEGASSDTQDTENSAVVRVTGSRRDVTSGAKPLGIHVKHTGDEEAVFKLKKGAKTYNGEDATHAHLATALVNHYAYEEGLDRDEAEKRVKQAHPLLAKHV